jgi:hypothetical protein
MSISAREKPLEDYSDRVETECSPASLIFRARGTAAAEGYGEEVAAARIAEARWRSG